MLSPSPQSSADVGHTMLNVRKQTEFCFIVEPNRCPSEFNTCQWCMNCKPRDQIKRSINKRMALARALGGTLRWQTVLGSCMGEGISSLLWGHLLSAWNTLKCFRLRCMHEETWQHMICGERCCLSVHSLVFCSVLFRALLMFGLKQQIRCIFPPVKVPLRTVTGKAMLEWNWQGRTEFSEKNLSHWHFVRPRSHKDWRGIEHGPLR